MLRIQALLHPTDFSPGAEAALDYALGMARRHDAVLHVLHVTPLFGDDPVRGALAAHVDDTAFYRRLRDAMDERMRALLDRPEAAGVQVRRVHSRGRSPGEVIVGYAASEGMDVVVLGTRGRHGVRALLLGSVSRDVIHEAGCPVLAVRSRRPGASATGFRRILAPIDFSVHSINALAYAKHLAATYDAALDVLHVVDPTMNEQIQKAGLRRREGVEGDVRALAQERLAWFCEAVEGPAPARLAHHLATGYAPERIVEVAAERDADLIVVASHGLTGLQRFPLGSVASRVVRAAPCPVFVTRPFGRSLLPPVDGGAEAAAHVAAGLDPSRSQPV